MAIPYTLNPSEYWMPSGAINITLNAEENPQKLKVEITSGSYIAAYRSGVIDLDKTLNFRQWILEGTDTELQDSAEVFIYAQLGKTGEKASIIFSTEILELTDSSDFFNIFLGSISSSVNDEGESIPRTWVVNINTGTLDINQFKFSPSEYWMSPDALTIELNALDNPQYLQVSLLAGSIITAYRQDVIPFDASLNFRKWNLQAYNNFFDRTDRVYVYAQLDKEGSNALIVYSYNFLPTTEMIISDTEESKEVFNIYLGTISASVNSAGESIPRGWETPFDTGRLNTDQYKQEDQLGEWSKMFRLNKVTDMIEVLKDMTSAVIHKLYIGARKILITDIQTSSESDKILEASDSIIPTTKFLKVSTESKFHRKDISDTNPFLQYFLKGIIFGKDGFAEGLTGYGAKIDENGNGEMRRLKLWESLTVPQLNYNRVEVVIGDKWRSAGAGVIDSCTPDEDTEGNILSSGTCTLRLEEGEIGAIDVDDIAMGMWHFGDGSDAIEDSDDGIGNFTFAGFTTIYFRITEILGENKNQFKYSLRSGYNAHPQPQMTFSCRGNFTNTERQTSVYETRTYTRMLINQNTWDIGKQNIGLQYGDLSNLNIFGLEMKGYSMYLNSVYFTGVIKQVKPDGTPIMTANDRGAWESGKKYDYYDRVSHNGSLWLCVNEEGSKTEPSKSNSDWLLQVEKGEDGSGEASKILVIDADNQNVTISADKDGNIKYGLPTNISFFAYVNNYSKEIKRLELPTVEGLVMSVSDNVLTITDYTLEDDFVKFSVNVVVETDGVEDIRPLSISVTRVRAGEDGVVPPIYEIAPSDNVIKVDKSGKYSPSLLSCTVRKTDKDSVSGVNPADEGLELRYSVDGNQELVYKGEFETTGINSIITFILYRQTTVIDKEDIPVIKDGNDGSDGSDGNDGVSPVVYSLYPSDNIVQVSEGTYHPTTVSCKLKKIIGEGVSIGNTLPEGYSIKYKKDNNPQQSYIIDTAIDTTDVLTNIVFYLYKEDTEIDAVRIAVVKNGDNATAGASPRYRGFWSEEKRYVYTDEDRDIVIFGNSKYRVKNKGQVPVGTDPTNTEYWEEASEFEFIAMDTALIDNANIAGFIFRKLGEKSDGTPYGELKSQNNDTDGTPMLMMNTQTGRIEAKDVKIKGEVNATSGAFENVLVNGSIKSPFKYASFFGDEIADNLVVPNDNKNDSYNLLFTIPEGISENIGRRITITFEPGYGKASSQMVPLIINGEEKFESLHLYGNQTVDLLGYGINGEFRAWIVLTDTRPDKIVANKLICSYFTPSDGDNTSNGTPWYGLGFDRTSTTQTYLNGFYGVHFRTGSGSMDLDNAGGNLSVSGNVECKGYKVKDGDTVYEGFTGSITPSMVTNERRLYFKNGILYKVSS